MGASIVTDKLTKRYGRGPTLALDGLTLQVQAGEIYGYLGANGAGKSTTIRLLLNFLQPSGGSAHINGFDVVKDAVEVKKHVGYLAGDVALYPKVTGGELLDYLGALQGMANQDYRRTLEKRFEAETGKQVSALSKGNRQKIGIVQAFMHQPNVLVLDEPTSGLDPLMQEAFYETVREARDRGAAVLMSSHNLAEAQRVCDRVGIIKHGKLIREQAVAGDGELGKTIFRVLLATPSAVARLKKAPHLKFLSQEGGNTALVQADGTVAEALKALSQFDIRDISTQALNLEDEFMEFYETGDDV
ncbi:MAG TPA: ABC transporter ATP-binding protein [Candidatus Saccharimonadales bacterium]|nr:ABC transporter ATP-binding protein [Candidatus Saccharimonadales bacterium]